MRVHRPHRSPWRIASLTFVCAILILLAASPARADSGDSYYFPCLLGPALGTEAHTDALVAARMKTLPVQPESPLAPIPSGEIASAPKEDDAKASLTPPPCAGYVTRVGDQLMLDGQPFRFVGVNVSYLLEDYFPEEETPKILSYLADSGVTALRVWLYPHHDVERAARLFDLGTQHNLRFVVTLVNYYYDKGGWWFDPTHYSKEYLPHVRAVVAQFADRPEIMMWELMNEPNCSTDTAGGCPGNMLRWAKAVSQEIKTLAPCHLITTGTIRIDGDAEHYASLHAIETIDVVSIHKAADLWLEREIEIADQLQKPVLIGEVYARGYDKSCRPMRDGILQERSEQVAADMARAYAAGVDGYLLWQYGHGRVEVGDQVQYYCNGYDYLPQDPIWDKLTGDQSPWPAVSSP
jgi:hypothetical protein